MRAAVVGHLEWVEFVRVEAVPRPGDIVHASEWWSEPAGGGPGAAVQLAKLADESIFFTAVGDDDLGRRALEDLERRGVRVEAVTRQTSTRRAITHIDSTGERTITVLGERLAPHGADRLAWEALEDADCVYFTAGDRYALHRARRARVVVATARVLPLLVDAAVQLDAIVASAFDPAEAYAGELDPPPGLVVSTEGGDGGTFRVDGGRPQRYRAAEVPAPIVDRYGAGDSFAGALAYALGEGRPPEEAVSFAARCGAAVLTGRGPYEGQLRREDLEWRERRGPV